MFGYLGSINYNLRGVDMGNCNCNGCVYYAGSGNCRNDAECWDYELKKERVEMKDAICKNCKSYSQGEC